MKHPSNDPICTCQWRTDEIGNALHQQQQPVRVGETFQRDEFHQNNTGQRIVCCYKQSKSTSQHGKAL